MYLYGHMNAEACRNQRHWIPWNCNYGSSGRANMPVTAEPSLQPPPFHIHYHPQAALGALLSIFACVEMSSWLIFSSGEEAENGGGK